MLYPLLNSYIKPLARITEITCELLAKRKTFHNFEPSHHTLHRRFPITFYPTEPQFPSPHLKVSRHGETGQSKEKSISFRSSRRFAIAKHRGY